MFADSLILPLIFRSILLIGLAIASFEDLITGKIHLILVLILSFCGAVFQVLTGQNRLWDILLGAALGGALILLSFLSRRSIGMGDGMMFVATGIFLGLSDNLWLLLLSLGMSAIASLVLLILLKYKGKDRIPFIPFMLTGYICLLLII